MARKPHWIEDYPDPSDPQAGRSRRPKKAKTPTEQLDEIGWPLPPSPPATDLFGTPRRLDCFKR